jgi:hypothetical protein
MFKCAAGGVLIAGLLALATPAISSEALQATQNGRKFLVSLMDTNLGLLPEYRGANVYWLFHDNYLAAKVLSESHPQISNVIQATLRREGFTKSGKIEIVFGEAEKPLPFRQYQLRDVRREGNKLIRTEVVTEKPLEGWEKYADLLLMASLAERNQTKARQHWEAALLLWDGKGFLDAAAKHQNRYATYKLGLALLAGGRLSPPAQVPTGLEARLLALQAQSGGWITDYNSEGKKLGLANVETTCLAILGIEAAEQTKSR